MVRERKNINGYPDDAFDEIITGIKRIDVPDIKIDKKKVMRGITNGNPKYSFWRYLVPVIWSYLTVSAFYFFYYFREIISNIFLYYAGSKLRWISQIIIKLIKLVSFIPNEFLIALMVVPILSLIFIFAFKLVISFKNPRRRKYEKIF
ncbi:MAG: hypothetical protein GWP03_03255 [Proteobacteria bacterium]|nr:hypothetical protein [Pseudomonadota bacterium]